MPAGSMNGRFFEFIHSVYFWYTFLIFQTFRSNKFTRDCDFFHGKMYMWYECGAQKAHMKKKYE